ncbi:MAG: hypothetical protein M1115_01185 [Actinobacteria bacterium]|nr:hypothetical protein [Actinomycetota bacterium]
MTFTELGGAGGAVLAALVATAGTGGRHDEGAWLAGHELVGMDSSPSTVIPTSQLGPVVGVWHTTSSTSDCPGPSVSGGLRARFVVVSVAKSKANKLCG